MAPLPNPGMYGMKRVLEITNFLPGPEATEPKGLLRRLWQNEALSAAEDKRRRVLFDKTLDLYETRPVVPEEPRTPENALGLYAEQIGERMRLARVRDGSERL